MSKGPKIFLYILKCVYTLTSNTYWYVQPDRRAERGLSRETNCMDKSSRPEPLVRQIGQLRLISQNVFVNCTALFVQCQLQIISLFRLSKNACLTYHYPCTVIPQLQATLHSDLESIYRPSRKSNGTFLGFGDSKVGLLVLSSKLSSIAITRFDHVHVKYMYIYIFFLIVRNVCENM